MKSSRMKSLMLTSDTVAEYDIIGLFHNPPVLNTTLTAGHTWATGVDTCRCHDYGMFVWCFGLHGGGTLQENTVNFAVVLPRGEAEEGYTVKVETLKPLSKLAARIL